MVLYRQSGEIALTLAEPRAVAVGPQDRVYVAGDKTIAVFNSAGTKASEITLAEEPRAVAVAGESHAHPGRLYVAMKDHVEVLDPAGKRLAAWESLGPKALLTSIAVGEEGVYVADAGNRIVHRYNLEGKFLAGIGKRDQGRGIPGFVIPSPYFDVAISPDGLVRVANPGGHRIEAYTPQGHLEVFWGESGTAIERFCGCCNPANFAVLPDGRFVTAEKGIPRVKLYDPEGKFVGVVVGPDVLAPGATILEETRDEHRLPVVDVAADARGRVLVLDPGAKKVRVFEPKESSR
jgi:DNA-binding beta-propeller fold protein YncE